MGFYTYLWLREDGTPYYVGKGQGRRGFISAGHNVHHPKDRARILIQEHPSEEDAFAAEIFLITYYGRSDLGLGCLQNRTNGGDGPSGFIPTAKMRRALSLAARNRKPRDLASLHEGNRGNKYVLGKHWSGKHKHHVSGRKEHQVHALHVRWHVNRGKKKAGCPLC